MPEDSAIEQGKAELLDGKRRCTNQDAGADGDVFMSEFVAPLRQLRGLGFFDESRETKTSLRGVLHVSSYHVISAINYNAEIGESGGNEE